METMRELIKDIDMNWIINICHNPGVKLNTLQEQIISKYNHITADEAKKIILLVALTDASIKAVKDLKRPEA